MKHAINKKLKKIVSYRYNAQIIHFLVTIILKVLADDTLLTIIDYHC